ncbi:unnamed protein product [Oppiella nova]|uniref:Glutathione S-transferase n=1 Tax=Oppiella nova TaxID=334625 RepID=A0A7R9LZW4_9ACAR|nr:unnamed protein product [Oppiella nova]CAG2167928.1 unnamed protein product [Oppiella nova]
MPIELYYSALSAPCRSVLMAFKQLNLDVNIKLIDLGKGEQFSEEYLKLNPNHKVPTIVDDDLVLWESRAIMQYLCNKYAPNSSLYPSNPKDRALVDRWLYTDMPYFAANIDVLVNTALLGTKPTDQQMETYRKTLKLIDTLIGGNKYVAGGGNLTIADLSLTGVTSMLAINEYKDLDEYPNLKTWYNGMQLELSYFQDVNGMVYELYKQNANKFKSI